MRISGVDVEKDILLTLQEEGPMTMRELQRKLGRYWNAVHYHLRAKKDNLVARGCVVEERIVGETSNRAQSMFKYRINPEMIDECLQD